MTSDLETFRQGATAYRNLRDWTKEQRDAARVGRISNGVVGVAIPLSLGPSGLNVRPHHSAYLA
jgi:hypothetical protein